LEERTNEQWVQALGGQGQGRALNDLRVILVRGLKASLRARVRSGLDEIVEDFAQEALIKIMSNLDSFRGESRFTTWAQKIAVRVAFTELRRLRWQDVSLDEALERHEHTGSRASAFADAARTPEEATARAEVVDSVRMFVDQELTERQRVAMTVVMFEGLPLEEAARRMGTNRNALYKLLYDARKRLKKRLEREGFTPEEVLEELARR
jgi:RNA polymerase sigma-70 factor, ECF subfamily